MTEQMRERLYRFVPYGGGIEEIDRFGVRDRIRSGDIVQETELAVAGTDEWLAAGNYPEFARYFTLASTRPATQPGIAPAKPREVRPMGERVLQGLGYPLAGGAVLTLIGLAVFEALPVLSILAALSSTGLMLEVVRKSADGKTKMPPFLDTSDIPGLLRHYWRVLFVTLIALAPAIGVTVWAFAAMFVKAITPATAMAVVFAAAAIGAIYYPACLATVAVWDNVLASLNPVYVYRVISIIGGDYFIVVAMWFVATGLTIFGGRATPLSGIPLVGRMFTAFLSYYVLFYASHLLGYAVYRHAPELGWE